jgi:hypothetical protein
MKQPDCDLSPEDATNDIAPLDLGRVSSSSRYIGAVMSQEYGVSQEHIFCAVSEMARLSHFLL